MLWEILLSDIIVSIVGEWLSTFHELISLDTALISHCSREKYLAALKCVKNDSYDATINDNAKWKKFIIWKETRAISICRLRLKSYHPSADYILLIKFFAKLVELTIDSYYKAEFDLSLIIFGNFPKLKILRLANLQISFSSDTHACHCNPLELKELHITYPHLRHTVDRKKLDYMVTFAKLCPKLKKLCFNVSDLNFLPITTIIEMAQLLPELQYLEYSSTEDVVLPSWGEPIMHPNLINPAFQSKLETVNFQIDSFGESDTSSFIMMLLYLCNNNTVKDLNLSLSFNELYCDLFEQWIVSNGQNLVNLTLFAHETEMSTRENSILRTIAQTCQNLEIIELHFFESLELLTIQQLFRDGVCKKLKSVSLYEITRASDILQVLCESNYPIDSVTIYSCHLVSIATISKLLDTFPLKEFHWIIGEELQELEDPICSSSSKRAMMEFIQTFLVHANIRTTTLTHFTLDLTAVMFSLDVSDEATILKYWQLIFLLCIH